MNLEYESLPKPNGAIEQVFGRILQTTLLDLERSAALGCHACLILQEGIRRVEGSTDSLPEEDDVRSPPVVIRLRRGRNLELRIGDVVDCDTIEFYTHLGSDLELQVRA